MRFKIIIVFVLFLSSFGCPKRPETAQSAKEVVVLPNFANAATITPFYDRGSKSLKVQIKLADGFHAYADGEKIGKPVSLKILDKNGWKTTSPTDLPRGKKKILGSLGESQVLEGVFEVEAFVAGGHGPIEAELALQVCTSEACDRPRLYPLLIEVNSEQNK